MIGATLKDFDRFTLKVDCDGPVKGLTAETRPGGAIRGYAKEPLADVPVRGDGKFDVAGIVGSGMLYSIRESGFELGLHREPYVGSVPIVSGEIGEDVAYYLANSEQIPSAVLVGVLLAPTEPFVRAAGGVLIQMMPGASEHVVTMIEDTVAHAPHVTRLIDEGAGPVELAQAAIGEFELNVLDETEVRFHCECSQEKAATMIAALGRDEVVAMIEEDNGAVMTCGFCSETYSLSSQELREILETL